MTRGRALAGVAALLIVAVVALVTRQSGDDGDGGRADDATTTTAAPHRPATVDEAPASASTVPVPTSSVPEEGIAAADEILATAGPELALTPAQQDCLANRLAGDVDLREQVGSDPAPGSDGFGVLVEEGERCVIVVDVAPGFVATIEPSLDGELTDDDRRCLATAYADLTDGARQAMLDAGLEPGSERADDGRQVLDDLLASCDLARAG